MLTGSFGFILALLALAVGIMWLVFPFIAMARLRGIRDEVERGNRYLAELSNRNSYGVEVAPRPTVRIANVARVVPTPKVVPAAKLQPTTGVIPPPSVVPLKISKGGQKLGLKDTTSIKVMLKNGELTLEDRYFDVESNEWVALHRHPEFSQ
jgi:hypothetical protein